VTDSAHEGVYHELQGSGPPIVFIHAGIADSGMWEPQWASFAGRYRLLRLDLAGFGRTPIERLPVTPARDVVGLLDELGISAAGVVGASLGGRVALEVAVARPDLVRALVLVDAGLPGVEWSEAVRSYGAAEDEAVTRGDLAAATELNLRMWVDGPGRAVADVDPAVRSAVAEMQRRALELHAPYWESHVEELLVPDVAERLDEVQAPTLVLVGEEDVDDMQVLAKRFAAEIPRARLATIPGAGHVPSIEQPAAFDARVLPFLADELGR
jgi:pimeloyl-ACP methyl ester carboxylesterase